MNKSLVLGKKNIITVERKTVGIAKSKSIFFLTFNLNFTDLFGIGTYKGFFDVFVISGGRCKGSLFKKNSSEAL